MSVVAAVNLHNGAARYVQCLRRGADRYGKGVSGTSVAASMAATASISFFIFWPYKSGSACSREGCHRIWYAPAIKIFST